MVGAAAMCDKATMVAARLREADEISNACAKSRAVESWRTSTNELATLRAIALWREKGSASRLAFKKKGRINSTLSPVAPIDQQQRDSHPNAYENREDRIGNADQARGQRNHIRNENQNHGSTKHVQ
jgi:hypothetical protein